jgi:hypothetical protein
VNRRLLLIMLAALLLWPHIGWAAAGDWAEMYPVEQLTREKPRLEGRANQMLGIVRTLIAKGGLAGSRAPVLASVRIDAPLSDDAGVPLDFASRYSANTGVVIAPVLSLLFLEDLCTAYAWLYKKGLALDTIDEYLTMLRYKRGADFPQGRYMAPLVALGIPATAADDPDVSGLALRFRNSAYAFIVAHELGHIIAGHPSADTVTTERSRANEAAADDFALRVLAVDSEIPMGAILFFEAQAYLMPSFGQFKARGLDEQAWLKEMQSKITHPLTAERLKLLAAGIERQAEMQPPANRESWEFVALKLLALADILADVDLQHCVSVAATRAPVSELMPQNANPAERFLGKCVKQP